MSITRTTPASTHFAAGAFVLRNASNTYVGPRIWVLYTGHLFCSSLSATAGGVGGVVVSRPPQGKCVGVDG